MIRTYGDIKYELIRSRRRTGAIQIERDGRITVRAPLKASLAWVEQMLGKKLLWVNRGLAQWKKLNACAVKRGEYVKGEQFPFMGRLYALDIIPTAKRSLVFDGTRFLLRQNALAKAQEFFKRFYREQGYLQFPGRIDLYRKRLGVSPTHLRVLDLKSRWGSCSSKGHINLHWKLVMAPLSIIDYVVVHELAHLIHLNHSPAFWMEVEKVMPGYREHREWLKVNGAAMEA